VANAYINLTVSRVTPIAEGSNRHTPPVTRGVRGDRTAEGGSHMKHLRLPIVVCAGRRICERSRRSRKC